MQTLTHELPLDVRHWSRRRSPTVRIHSAAHCLLRFGLSNGAIYSQDSLFFPVGVGRRGYIGCVVLWSLSKDARFDG